MNHKNKLLGLIFFCFLLIVNYMFQNCSLRGFEAQNSLSSSDISGMGLSQRSSLGPTLTEDLSGGGTYNSGQAAILKIKAVSKTSSPLNFKWKKNGQFLQVGNVSEIKISNISEADVGTYQVFVYEQNGYGTQSQIAKLNIAGNIGDPSMCITVTNGATAGSKMITVTCDGSDFSFNNFDTTNLKFLSAISLNKQKNAYYFKTATGVYYFSNFLKSSGVTDPQLIAGVKPDNFYVGGDDKLKNQYGVNSETGNVILGGNMISNSTISSFVVLNEFYAKDAYSAYFEGNQIEHSDLSHFKPLISDIAGQSSPSTYPDLARYASGNNLAFYNGSTIGTAPNGSMAILLKNYVRAGSSLYLEGKYVGEAGEYQVLNTYYLKDGSQVYFNGSTVFGADLATFRTFGNYMTDQYAADAANLYFKGQKVNVNSGFGSNPPHQFLTTNLVSAGNYIFCNGGILKSEKIITGGSNKPADSLSLHKNPSDQSLADNDSIYTNYSNNPLPQIGCTLGTEKPPPEIPTILGGGLYSARSSASIKPLINTTDLTYQWEKDGLPLVGQTLAVLNYASLTAAQTGDYRLKVTDTLGRTALSPIARLDIIDLPGWPKTCFELDGTVANIKVAYTCGYNSLTKYPTDLPVQFDVIGSCGGAGFGQACNDLSGSLSPLKKLHFIKTPSKILLFTYPWSSSQDTSPLPSVTLSTNINSFQIKSAPGLNYQTVAVDMGSTPARIWLNDKELIGSLADPGTLVPIALNFNGPATYQKDIKTIYFNGAPIKGSDPLSFRILDNMCQQNSIIYGVDKNNFYQNNQIVESISTDPSFAPGKVSCLGINYAYAVIKTGLSAYCPKQPYSSNTFDFHQAKIVDLATFVINSTQASDTFSNYDLYNCKQTLK